MEVLYRNPCPWPQWVLRSQTAHAYQNTAIDAVSTVPLQLLFLLYRALPNEKGT